jgi:hypothetical protein
MHWQEGDLQRLMRVDGQKVADPKHFNRAGARRLAAALAQQIGSRSQRLPPLGKTGRVQGDRKLQERKRLDNGRFVAAKRPRCLV